MWTVHSWRNDNSAPRAVCGTTIGKMSVRIWWAGTLDHLLDEGHPLAVQPLNRIVKVSLRERTCPFLKRLGVHLKGIHSNICWWQSHWGQIRQQRRINWGVDREENHVMVSEYVARVLGYKVLVYVVIRQGNIWLLPRHTYRRDCHPMLIWQWLSADKHLCCNSGHVYDRVQYLQVMVHWMHTGLLR